MTCFQDTERTYKERWSGEGRFLLLEEVLTLESLFGRIEIKKEVYFSEMFGLKLNFNKRHAEAMSTL